MHLISNHPYLYHYFQQMLLYYRLFVIELCSYISINIYCYFQVSILVTHVRLG